MFDFSEIDYKTIFKSFPSVISSSYFGSEALEGMKLVVRQQHSILYTEVFEQNISSILGKFFFDLRELLLIYFFADIIFEGCKKPLAGRHKTLMELLVYIPKLSEQHQKNIEAFLLAHETPGTKYLAVCMDVRRSICFNKMY